MTKRILHVVGGMNRGGVETWLMHVLRNIDRDEFQIDFLVHTVQDCAFDEEIRSLGSRIVPCLSPSNPIQYANNFYRILREYGPYDIVHSHVHHFSGYVLWLAATAKVPIRIAHSHSDTRRLQQAAAIPRSTYYRLAGWLVKRYSTHKIAVSQPAASALFGTSWERDPRARVFYCGIDLVQFDAGASGEEARSAGSTGRPGPLFLHVGRFHPQKNHAFLIQVAAEVVRREPRSHFLLVGDGPLRPQIELLARQQGIADQVTFAGLRDDIANIMATTNAFVLPSLHEGLPVVLLEAQAAGLPSLYSDEVTDEVALIPELMYRMPLKAGPAAWAERLLSISRSAPRLSPNEAVRRMRLSPFNIERSVQELKQVYSSAESRLGMSQES